MAEWYLFLFLVLNTVAALRFIWIVWYSLSWTLFFFQYLVLWLSFGLVSFRCTLSLLLFFPIFNYCSCYVVSYHYVAVYGSVYGSIAIRYSVNMKY